jgi:DNA-binding transcriptional ArsR family regulator
MMAETTRLARAFKTLGAENRLRIVGLLRARPLCVNALAARLGLTPAAVSQHLKVLRAAGLVESDKRGYYVHYRLNEGRLAQWRDEIDKLLDPKYGAAANAKGTAKCAAMRRKKAVRNRRA